MWTEEKLKEAAQEYIEKVVAQYNRGGEMPPMNEVFLAGCKYIINNTQKEI